MKISNIICFNSLYFDDGKIASETIDIIEKIRGEYEFIGSGYFRFVYNHQFYTLQYSGNSEKLEGTLGN